MSLIGYEEGENCHRPLEDGKPCSGTMVFAEVEGCSCHINPPCGACTTNPLVCDVCGDGPMDEFE